MGEGAHRVGRLRQFAAQVQIGRVHLQAGLLLVQLHQEVGHADGLAAGPRPPFQAEHVQQTAFQSLSSFAWNQNKNGNIQIKRPNERPTDQVGENTTSLDDC